MNMYNYISKSKRLIRLVVSFFILTITTEYFAPLCAYALTSGPSQPEVQSCEPIGTTQMVDPFTGDFVYNIPLLCKN